MTSSRLSFHFPASLVFGPILWLHGCGCGEDNACSVDLGDYHAFAPDDWDGESALPVIISAHGFNGDAQVTYERDSLRTPYARAGALWLVPEGEDNTWNVSNSPVRGRDEARFYDQMLADAHERFGIDQERVAVGGFSLGSSLGHTLACADPTTYSHVLGISGTFWEPTPASCSGALAVRHTHGTADETWPLEGRSFDDTWAQGTVEDMGWTWATTGDCAAEPDIVEEDGQTCQVWSGCTTGEVRVCLHNGGHEIPETEGALQVAWLRDQGFFR